MMERKQFLKAYEAYANPLFRYCYFKVADREAAKDLLQTTFLRTWEYLCEGGVIYNIRAFLYQTARHLLVDYYRQRETASLDELRGEGFDLPEAGQNPEGRLAGEEALACLRQLPEIYREAVFMRYVDDFSIKEIAELLGESENTITVRIHRGLEKLRKLIESWKSVSKK